MADRLRAEAGWLCRMRGQKLKKLVRHPTGFQAPLLGILYQSLSGELLVLQVLVQYWSSAGVCASGATINCESRLIAGILSVLTGQNRSGLANDI